MGSSVGVARRLAPVGVVVVLGLGCASGAVQTRRQQQQSAVQSIFDLRCDGEAFGPYTEPGGASIRFQAFLRTRGGDVKYGAGSDAVLVPAVDCAQSWWALSGSDLALASVYPRAEVFWSALRKTTADGEGRFRFDGVAPGKYYVRTIVTWQVPMRYGMSTQGGYVGREVEIRDGENAEIILTY
jgi:hypothetical protein